MLKIGELEIHLINDCRAMVDPGGPFGLVPRKLWSRYITPSEDHLVPMNYTCLYVRSGAKQIVVDTGFGTKLDERSKQIWQIEKTGGLIAGLEQLGVQAQDVDLVIDTHLHSDHCGGNTRFSESSMSEVEATFPNAEYVVQRREYEDAMHPNERTQATYHFYNYQPLVESGQMRLLQGDTELAKGISGIVTPGHTPGHMSVFFESGGEHAAFLCDLATYAVHFERLAWITAYDVEPLVTLESKRKWQQWALETNAVLIFPHDTLRPVGRLIQNESGHMQVQAIEEPYVNATWID